MVFECRVYGVGVIAPNAFLSAIAPPNGGNGSMFAPEVLAGFWTSPENGNPPPCTVYAAVGVLGGEKE